MIVVDEASHTWDSDTTIMDRSLLERVGLEPGMWEFEWVLLGWPAEPLRAGRASLR